MAKRPRRRTRRQRQRSKPRQLSFIDRLRDSERKIDEARGAGIIRRDE